MPAREYESLVKEDENLVEVIEEEEDGDGELLTQQTPIRSNAPPIPVNFGNNGISQTNPRMSNPIQPNNPPQTGHFTTVPQPQIIINSTPHNYLPTKVASAPLNRMTPSSNVGYSQAVQLPVWQKTPINHSQTPSNQYGQVPGQASLLGQQHTQPLNTTEVSFFKKASENQIQMPTASNSALSNFLASRPPIQQPS